MPIPSVPGGEHRQSNPGGPESFISSTAPEVSGGSGLVKQPLFGCGHQVGMPVSAHPAQSLGGEHTPTERAASIGDPLPSTADAPRVTVSPAVEPAAGHHCEVLLPQQRDTVASTVRPRFT
jgi:hypothetical protein